MGADQATEVLPPVKAALPGQVVLALQGGGALGAYQAAVYRAMHEAGMEPGWVIGTSIGAINGAIIAGNKPKDRLARLHQFWDNLDAPDLEKRSKMWCGLDTTAATTLMYGIPRFFKPNPASWMGPLVPLGVERAAYYSTEPLRENLLSLVDFEYIKEKHTRLTVGAVGVNNGEMRYFSSRYEALGPDHIMASCALPPAFPAMGIAGEAYWDGGIYSNTPIEAVLDDYPRLSSLIFTVQLWSEKGVEPDTIWQVMGRQKDIRYASRAKSHLERQQQIHRLRHVIRELAGHIKEGPQFAGGQGADSLGLRYNHACRQLECALTCKRRSNQGY
jgi:NTE family protein